MTDDTEQQDEGRDGRSAYDKWLAQLRARLTEEEDQQEQDEPDRVLSHTTYDSDPALTAEEARNETRRAEAESSDGDE